jgi:hypothetical protein
MYYFSCYTFISFYFIRIIIQYFFPIEYKVGWWLSTAKLGGKQIVIEKFGRVGLVA